MSRAALLPILLLSAAGLLWPGRAHAQGTVTVDLSTTTLAFPAPGFADFDAGAVQYGPLAVSITSRPGTRPWELRVRSASATLGPGKPVADLQWRLDGSSVWNPLSVTDATILQGSGDGTVTVHFRMLLSWGSDGPGSYSTGLDFTIVRL